MAWSITILNFFMFHHEKVRFYWPISTNAKLQLFLKIQLKKSPQKSLKLGRWVGPHSGNHQEGGPEPLYSDEEGSGFSGRQKSLR